VSSLLTEVKHSNPMDQMAIHDHMHEGMPMENTPVSGIPMHDSHGMPAFEEGRMSIEDIGPNKKAIQAPKTTIILYTLLVIILIACVVLVTVWKGPFKIFVSL
jgi:hypothetical protein